MQLYKLSIPIINECITEENRPILAELFHKAQADRVVLAFHGVFACDIPALHKNIAFFREQGFEVVLWVGHTIGHVGAEFPFAEGDLPYQRILRRDGLPAENTFCPLDPAFQAHIGRKLAEIVQDADVQLVMLDDDCTTTQKGFGCTCARHLERMHQHLGETPDRDFLAKQAFTGTGNRYRDAWIKAQGEGITEFMETVRDHVHRVRPDITLSACTVFSHWSFDGVDVPALSQALAGDHPPFQRLHGAPYWSATGSGADAKSLNMVCETARMFASFFRGSGIETAAEGDVYPRPRTNCSASRLELFDAAMRADGGYDGILKYMINYHRCPEQETGYIDRHVKDLPHLREIQSFFDGGANCGVNICTCKNPVQNADLDFAPELFYPTDLDAYPRCVENPVPYAGQLFGAAGIPTVHNAAGLCDAVFWENARQFDLRHLSQGVILDAKAAEIYMQQGFDVGMETCGTASEERIFSVREAQSVDGDPLVQDERCRATVSRFTLKPGCTPVLFAKTAEGEIPLAYTYENAEGRRFLVLTTDGFRMNWNNSPISGSYPMQRMLRRVLPWVAGKAFPFTAPVTPNLYVMCRETEQALSVLVCNMSEDVLLAPEFALRDSFSNVEGVACQGEIVGDCVRLTSDIPAFSFAAFQLTK